MIRDYVAIGNWCIDAHRITAAELPAQIAQMRADLIATHSGKPSILEIASDLAEGLSHLPTSQSSAAQEALRAKHGFGYDYFTSQVQLKLAKIIAKGRIRTENEHRAVLDALTDTTLDATLISQLQHLLATHESDSGAA